MAPDPRTPRPDPLRTTLGAALDRLAVALGQVEGLPLDAGQGAPAALLSLAADLDALSARLLTLAERVRVEAEKRAADPLPGRVAALRAVLDWADPERGAEGVALAAAAEWAYTDRERAAQLLALVERAQVEGRALTIADVIALH